MPQISLYFDETLARAIGDGASKNNISVSKYVSTILYQHINDEWPEGYFEVLGSLAESTLRRPMQPNTALNAPREQL